MSWHFAIFLILCFACVVYAFTWPLVLHYRTKYAGRTGRLVWRGIYTFLILATILGTTIYVMENI